MMKKKILLRGPVLSRSGYGEQARFALRSLLSVDDVIDVHVISTNWGKTSWLPEDNEERRHIDSLIMKTAQHIESGGQFDASIQVTIPNEWERLAPINIGYTAGIETDRVAPIWLEKCKLMNQIVVTSEHAKKGFTESSYTITNKDTGEQKKLETNVQIEAVGYPAKLTSPQKIDLSHIETKFNFLTVAQWGVRKNLENTIGWFIEEFSQQEVGLIIKANTANNCTMDRVFTHSRLRNLLNSLPDSEGSSLNHDTVSNMKCKIYLLHGDMTDNEMVGLYRNEKVKSLISFSHGEGYGLPLFEAAQCGLPIAATAWSGHLDFLTMPVKNKKGKVRNKGIFSKVVFELAPVQKEARWDGVINEDARWAYPKAVSAKLAMRDIHKNYNRHLSQARKLQAHIATEYAEEKMYKKFLNAAGFQTEMPEVDYIFVSDAFAEEYVGGAELSLQTLIDTCPGSHMKVKSESLNKRFLESYADKTWIFGNVSRAPAEMLKLIAQSEISYYVSESDYKYCEHRLPQLCEVFNAGDPCACGKSDDDNAKMFEDFYNNAETVFFRSKRQMEHHMDALELTNPNIDILSALFPDEFFEKVNSLRTLYAGNKSDKWVISSSPSWVKGTFESEKWCRDNNKDYQKLHGISHDDMLKALASSKGLCFLPKGFDTCPRLVIEAKLLGCELVTNDHVLHAEEEWFNTNDVSAIENHLKEQPVKFWNVVGK